jgi:hypothetical protein
VTIPFVLSRIGLKYALLTGMAMWGVRFLFFVAAVGDQAWPAIVGIALHGICNDFFLILGAMYVDRAAPEELKAQAQSIFVFISSGAGIFLGSLLGSVLYMQLVQNRAGAGGWAALWMVPIGISALTAILWATLFKQPPMPSASSGMPTPDEAIAR